MARHRKKAAVVWKDTNKYPFSILYSYPLAIRNRCLFFWATELKGWRAVLNLADRLTEPNRICVVYFFGNKIEPIKKHIDKLNNDKIFVLLADCDLEEMQTVMSGVEAINKAKKWGFYKGAEIDERNPYENETLESQLEQYFKAEEIISSIKNGRKALAGIQEKILRNGYKNLSENMKEVRADETGHLQDLVRAIKSLYPYGAEGDTQEEYAYKMVHFEKWCNSGIDGNMGKLEKLGVSYTDEKTEFVQLSLFDNTSWGIVEFVKAFRRICDSEIEKNGFVDLQMALQRMKDPPYGMYQCNCYGLCIGIALSKYSKGYLFCSCLYTQRTEDSDLAATVKFIFENEGRRTHGKALIYNQSEKQIRLVEKLLDVFGINKDIGVVCMQNAISYMVKWLEENAKYDTVQRLVPELFEILNLQEHEKCSNVTERYADWLTDEKAEQVKKDIRNIDNNFLEMLTKKYGAEKTALYRKSHGAGRTARSWLWKVEIVDDEVDNYMKKETICRECGLTINKLGYQVSDGVNGHNGKLATLTKQNVINLNKKFLGRCQNEYFCLNCLCEVLDTDEWSLYEKMLAFKEQGCELF